MIVFKYGGFIVHGDLEVLKQIRNRVPINKLDKMAIDRLASAGLIRRGIKEVTITEGPNAGLIDFQLTTKETLLGNLLLDRR